MTAVAMKCLDPQKLDDWQAARDIVTAEYDAKCAEFQKTIGGKNLIGSRFFKGGFQVTGFDWGSHKSEGLPAGWRLEQYSSFAVPAKRTAEGKAIAKQLRELYLPDNDHPGVPRHLHCAGFSIFPTVRKVGADWWLTMSKQPYETDMEQFDPTIWAVAKLSEYYAAVEAAPEGASE